MKIYALLILLSLHPVHVSLTGVDYNPEDRTYNIFIKVYNDDLRSDLEIFGARSNGIPLMGDEEYSRYLNDRFQIVENGKILRMQILNTESDGIEQRFTLSAKGKKNPSDVTIINRIMIRLYTDQSNMCLFRFRDVEEGYRFTASDTLRNYCVKMN